MIICPHCERRIASRKQLYDALRRFISLIDDIKRGDMPLRTKVNSVVDQAYAAINAADEEGEEAT